MVNEARVGFSRLWVENGTPEPLFSVNGTNMELPQFNVNPYPLMGGAGAFVTTVTGGGVALTRDNTYQAYDNVSWNVGRHSIKFGGGIYRVQYDRYEEPAVLGRFQFTNGFTTRSASSDGTGDPLASMLLGLPAVASRAVGPSRIDGRSISGSLYIQDDFHIASNLTLNFGLRYELSPPLSDAHQQMSSIDFSTAPTPQQSFASGKTGVANATLFVCGQSGYPAGCAYTDYRNFAPRVGIVWAPSTKTVIRAGSGVFFVNNDDNPLFRLAAGLPDNIAQTLTSNNYIPQYLNLNPFGLNVVGPVQLQAAGIDLHERSSYSLQWNLAVQRELSHNTVLEVGYLATLGFRSSNRMCNPTTPCRAPETWIPAGRTWAAVRPRYGISQLRYSCRQHGSHRADQLSAAFGAIELRVAIRKEEALQSRRIVSEFLYMVEGHHQRPAVPQHGGTAGSENSPPQNSFDLSAERGSPRSTSGSAGSTPSSTICRPQNMGLLSKALGNIQLSGHPGASKRIPIHT